jgi:DNA mismatch endonuclease, patch repair protein
MWRMGLRYLVNRSAIPGSRRRVDIVFPRQRVAVFVDGCFWHVCPDHGTWPKHNAQWWRQKLERNTKRDAESNAQLNGLGWTVIRVWEHEDIDLAANRVARVVNIWQGPRDPIALLDLDKEGVSIAQPCVRPCGGLPS